MAQAEAGKGSQRRDSDASLYANNWEIIFGKNKGMKVGESIDLFASGSNGTTTQHPCGNDCSKCGCNELYKDVK